MTNLSLLASGNLFSDENDFAYELSATVQSKQLAKTLSISGSSESGKPPNATFSRGTPRAMSTEMCSIWGWKNMAAWSCWHTISLLLVMPELIHCKVITSWITCVET